MMDAKERDVANRLGIDPDDPTVQRGLDLFNADADMLDALVQLRHTKNLTQDQVAERMNRDRTSVTRFERLDSDPHLSTVRRYALAVGATIAHEVEDVDAPPVSPPPIPQPAEPPTKGITLSFNVLLHESKSIEFDQLSPYRVSPATFSPELSGDSPLGLSSLHWAYAAVKGAVPGTAFSWRPVSPSYDPRKAELERWVEQ